MRHSKYVVDRATVEAVDCIVHVRRDGTPDWFVIATRWQEARLIAATVADLFDLRIGTVHVLGRPDADAVLTALGFVKSSLG